MKKAYLYRLYPTRQQAGLLQQQLDVAREVYNACLEERRELLGLGLAGRCAGAPGRQEQAGGDLQAGQEAAASCGIDVSA